MNANQSSGTNRPLSCEDPAWWQWWRSQMPIAQRYAYFDHAAVAPISEPARRAIVEFARQAAVDGDTVWPQWATGLSRLRANFASLLSCDADQICLVPNTTTGINLIAEGYPWQPGDSVVIPDGEFPSNLFPWLNQRSKGVEVRIVPRDGGAVHVDDLMAQVDDTTKIIAVSWVGYATGYRIDIDALVEAAHRRGVLVMLDAIQGLGVYPLDLGDTAVDFLAADGHKWLLGPEGAGMAYIDGEQLAKLRCTNVGWASVKNSHNYADPQLELRTGADRFESGSANMVGGAALNASLEMFLQVRRAHGETAIQDRILDLVEHLESRLRRGNAELRLPASRQRRSGIVTFQIPGMEPNQFRNRAAECDVVVSCRGGGVRASVHAYNNEEDIDRLIAVIDQAAK